MSKRGKARERLRRIIDAKYSVPTWLWVLASTGFGAVILFYLLTNPALVVPFTQYLPFHGWSWAPLLTGGGLLTMIGMAKDWVRFVRVGSFLSFTMWIFGSTTLYLTGGVANLIIFAGPMLILWAYTYVASYYREISRL